MRYKLIVPWTARLPLSRWISRRNRVFEAAVAGHQSEYKAVAHIEKH
jgi:hypothetical protein